MVEDDTKGIPFRIYRFVVRTAGTGKLACIARNKFGADSVLYGVCGYRAYSRKFFWGPGNGCRYST